MKMNGIKHIRNAPYHPSLKGLTKQFVQTFKRAMKTGQTSEPSLSTRLSQFLLTYRSTLHATNSTTPGELFLLETMFDLLKPHLQSLVTTKQAAQKEHHDQHSKLRQFSAGQLVMVRDFHLQDKWLPGVVKYHSGPVSYDVELGNGRMVKRQVDHL